MLLRRRREEDRSHAANVDERVIKHLELIQAVITRLANNSFLLKGWTLTLAAVFFGFGANGQNWRIAALGVLPVLGFWGLDGYFLSRERAFRGLYDAVRKPRTEIELFSMDYRPHMAPSNWLWGTQGRPNWLRSVFSVTLAAYYMMIPLAGAVILTVVHFYGRT